MIFLYITFFSFALIFIFLLLGVFLENKKSNKRLHNFAILVPCRNEESNIALCLNALKLQNYSKEHYSVYVLDDDSNDNTAEIAVNFCKNELNFKYLKVLNNSDKKLKAKANVINFGIEETTEEIIIICDADCVPNSDWASEINRNFLENINVVSGVTILNSNSIFGNLQNLDWIFLLSSGASSVNWGFPISCIGSNFSFRRETYLKIGGYMNLKFSLTEDLILFKYLTNFKKGSCRFPLNKKMLNISKPMLSYPDFIEQRKRWFWGSLDLNVPGKIVLGTAIFSHIFTFIFSIVYINFNFFFYLAFIDVLLLGTYLLKISEFKKIIYAPLFIIFFLINMILIPLSVFFKPNIEWKSRKYSFKGSNEL